MCCEVDSASESEYQGFLLGLRRPVRLADDLPPYLEPLGPPRPVAGDLYLRLLNTVERRRH